LSGILSLSEGGFRNATGGDLEKRQGADLAVDNSAKRQTFKEICFLSHLLAAELLSKCPGGMTATDMVVPQLEIHELGCGPQQNKTGEAAGPAGL